MAQAPWFALPLQSVTLIPIGGGVSQRRVFRRAGHLRPKREGSILARHVLLGDIGATNARFALLANGALGSVKSFDVARFARFADAAARRKRGADVWRARRSLYRRRHLTADCRFHGSIGISQSL
jgi:hypothetical protein